MAEARKKYFVSTIGCQMNEADSFRLAARLEQLGYDPTPNSAEADLIVVNTCVVRKQAENKAINRLRALERLKKQRPDVRIAVMGCLVGFKPNESLRQIFPCVDVFLPPSDFRPLLDLLGHEASDAKRPAADAFNYPDVLEQASEVIPPSVAETAVSAFVPVVLGCSFACTFCVIPYRRGAEKSRPPHVILEEVRRLADLGVREVVLLGQIVDRYGMDLGDGCCLSGLIQEVARIDGIWRVRFLTSHPNWFTDDLLKVIAEEPKICPQIELPVQSGNDHVLERMRRGYTVDQYRRLVEKIRRRLPDSSLHTDVIVGFPGETDEEFMDTYRLMQELRPDMIRIAKYSERPQTYAARHFPDDVPETEKERRRIMVEDLLENILLKKHADWLSRQVEVLVTEREKKGRWCGRTIHGKQVFFSHPGDLLGKLVNARITWTGAFSFIGEVVTVADEPLTATYAP